MFEKKSLTGVQTGFETVMSVVFQSPPPTLPAQTVFFVASFGSTNNERVLPPILFGPRSVQVIPGIAACVVFPYLDGCMVWRAYSFAASKRSRGTVFVV